MRKKSVARKSGPEPPRGASEDQPQPGIAGPGESIDPMGMPKDHESEETPRGKPRPAPAPGVPVSNEQYEWLKKKAKAVRKRPSKHAQEDPSEKR